MERPIGSSEVNRRPVETFRVAALAIPERRRFLNDLRTIQPLLHKLRRDVKKYAFPETLDGREPFDRSGEISAANRELNFVEFAFRHGRWRLQAREAIQASHLSQPMHLDN